MNREQEFKNQIRSGGQRLTTPRLGVFRVLLRHAPLSMNELVSRSRANGVDPATTYRTLDLFRSLGLIQEMGIGRHRLLELNDGFQAHHHHLICTGCGRITDFDSQTIEANLHQAGLELGFHIRSHQLEANGLCANCYKAAAAVTSKTEEPR